MTTKLLAIAILLAAFSVTYAAAQNATNSTLQNTETAQNPNPVATGQEAVPVITANGTEVAEADPAEAIGSLLNTIFTVAIPAITGLVVAIVAFIKSFTKDKKVNEALDTAITAAKYADTLGPKIQEQYVTSGAFKTAFEMLMRSLPPDQKAKIEEQIVRNVPPADLKVQAIIAQMKQLKSQLPAKAIADNDKSLGNLDKS